MTVEELIRELEQMNPNSEIRWAAQPSWPFEYSISGVVNVSPKDEDEEEESEEDPEMDYTNDYDPRENDIVYLVEGTQLGYLPSLVCREIGWRG